MWQPIATLMSKTYMDKPRQLSTGVQVTQEYQVYIRIHAYFSNKCDLPGLFVFRLSLQQLLLLITESRWTHYTEQDNPATDPILSHQNCYPTNLVLIPASTSSYRNSHTDLCMICSSIWDQWWKWCNSRYGKKQKTEYFPELREFNKDR